MIQATRNRLVTALFVALMLTALAATPVITEIAGFSGAAYADHCGTTSC